MNARSRDRERNRATRRVPEHRRPLLGSRGQDAVPTSVVGESAQGLDRDREEGEAGADALQSVEALGQKEKAKGQRVGPVSRAPGPAHERAGREDQAVRDEGGSARCGQGSVVAP